ncbi:MAG: hypothetical protein U0176_09215 [Bacteroidia bacterium]
MHGRSEQLAAVLEIVLRHLKQGLPSELQAQDFAHLLMPDRPMEPKKEQYIWVRLTQLYHEVLEFLAWKRFESESALKKVMVFEEVCRRNWERVIPETYEAGLKSLPLEEGAARFKGQLRMELPYSHYLAGKGFGKGGKHLDKIQEALDGHFVLQKLKYACAGVLEGEPCADPDQDALLNAALNFVRQRSLELPKVVLAYECAFHLLQIATGATGDSKEIFQVFEELFRQPAAFATDEAMDLFVHGQNYCIMAYRQGDGEMLNALVRLYESVLASGVALEDGFMQRQFFKNTVELMCRIGRWEWAEDFVAKYKNRVAHDAEELSALYCRAVVRFHQGDFRGVVRELYNHVTKLDGLDTGVGARQLLCQALWEVEEFEWLRGSLAAFNQYLRRHEEIEQSLRKRYLRFVNYFERATDAMTSRPDKRHHLLSSLLEEINVNEPPNAYPWLRRALSAATLD